MAVMRGRCRRNQNLDGCPGVRTEARVVMRVVKASDGSNELPLWFECDDQLA